MAPVNPGFTKHKIVIIPNKMLPQNIQGRYLPIRFVLVRSARTAIIGSLIASQITMMVISAPAIAGLILAISVIKDS